MNSQVSPKAFPTVSYNRRELQTGRYIPVLSIFACKQDRLLAGAREYKMLPLVMPGVIFEVMPLLMPLPLSAILTSADLPLESIRILLE